MSCQLEAVFSAHGRTTQLSSGPREGGTFTKVQGKGAQAKEAHGQPKPMATLAKPPPKAQPIRTGNAFQVLAEAQGGEDADMAGDDTGDVVEDKDLKAERKKLCDDLAAQLANIRAAKKLLSELDSGPATETAMAHNQAIQDDLESRLRLARAHYQELKPPEVRLSQAERDLKAARQKFDQTKKDQAEADKALLKALQLVHRLKEQQEAQEAKIDKLAQLVAEHHCNVGAVGRKNENHEGGSTPPGVTTAHIDPKADISSHPQFVEMQKQLMALQKAMEQSSSPAGIKRGAEAEADRAEATRARQQQ
jgi:hypothetical protein